MQYTNQRDVMFLFAYAGPCTNLQAIWFAYITIRIIFQLIYTSVLIFQLAPHDLADF